MAAVSVTDRRCRRRVRLRATAAVVAAVAMLVSGCSGTADESAGRDVVVMAASSLTDVIEAVFEGREDVTPVIAGSSTLVAQLAAGADADVLITDVAVLRLTPRGMEIVEVAPTWTPEEVQAVSGAELLVADEVAEISL